VSAGPLTNELGAEGASRRGAPRPGERAPRTARRHALHQSFTARSSGATAVQALVEAGLPPSVVAAGEARSTGLGITIPLMPPRAGLALSLEEWAAAPLGDRAKLASMRIAVAADHGAFGRAEAAAATLRALGVGEVLVIAPREGERMTYAVSTGAAMTLLEEGRVDRVVAFCGNGLGALDVATQFAEEVTAPHRARRPSYGDNLWRIVDGQRGDEPANVLALGARLLNVPQDPMPAFLKAFLADPAELDALKAPGVAQHGASSLLVDPKPERVRSRTLTEGSPFGGESIAEQIALTEDDRAKLASRKVVVAFDPSSAAATKQAEALRAHFGSSLELMTLDAHEASGSSPFEAPSDARVVVLTEGGIDAGARPTRGFWVPPEEAASRVLRPSHWREIAWFVENAPGGGAPVLDLPAAALADAATGGANLDVLKLFVKLFALGERAVERPHKPLYGDAVRFTSAQLGVAPMPAELSSWSALLEEAKASARRAS
jgi:ribose 5-phosphate isomerase RpiB